jgi:hypothetical protein
MDDAPDDTQRRTERHVKLMIGDLVGQIAMLRAENETLREQLQAAPTKKR